MKLSKDGIICKRTCVDVWICSPIRGELLAHIWVPFKYIQWTMHNVKSPRAIEFRPETSTSVVSPTRAGANVDSAAAVVQRRILYASPSLYLSPSFLYNLGEPIWKNPLQLGLSIPRLTFFNTCLISPDSTYSFLPD